MFGLLFALHKMVDSCAAIHCTNRRGDGNVKFHKFPLHDKKLCAKWVAATKRDSLIPKVLSYLCEEHFTADDYVNDVTMKLHEGVVPSIFKTLKSSHRMKRSRRRPMRSSGSSPTSATAGGKKSTYGSNRNDRFCLTDSGMSSCGSSAASSRKSSKEESKERCTLQREKSRIWIQEVVINELEEYGSCVGMSGKKAGGKKKGAEQKPKDKSEKEVSENGIEKGNVPVIITDHQVIDHEVQVNCEKPPQPKCSSSSSSKSVKRRFSFGKGKKKNYDASANGTKKNAGIRRSHSLSIFNKPDGQSRIPLFRPKNENKNAKKDSKTLSTSRLQIPTSFESRSLVLNPGMDSWRMAGLMDTVGKMNSDMAINTYKPESPPTVYLPPQGGVEDDIKMQDVELMSKELDDFIVNERICTTEPSTTTQSDNLVTNVSDSVKRTSSTYDNINNDGNITASQLLNEKVDELANILNVLTNGLEKECADEIPIEMRTENEVNVPPPCDVIPLLNLEEAIVSQTVTSTLPSSDDASAGVETCCSDELCSDVGGVVASTPDTEADEGGEQEYTIIQELYELDRDNTISVRKLHDVVLETQIQMPKAVCCEDWLVLDFSNGGVVS